MIWPLLWSTVAWEQKITFYFKCFVCSYESATHFERKYVERGHCGGSIALDSKLAENRICSHTQDIGLGADSRGAGMITCKNSQL